MTKNIFFTADEHYGHSNIIKYCNRPFANVAEMDAEIIARHNEVVRYNDLVYHLGDFTLVKELRNVQEWYTSKLNGVHQFLMGSHDKWLSGLKVQQVMEINVDSDYIVMCHYAMRVWARSHHNSWQIFGHSHGCLAPQGKQWDVGVDNNNFYPVSYPQLKEIMAEQPDNFNLVKTAS
jgi:calcineurin-like phosphoesterase family protein